MNKEMLISEICKYFGIKSLKSMYKMKKSEIESIHSLIVKLHNDLSEIKKMLIN